MDVFISGIVNFLADRVSVTTFGSPIAGENYFLECSAGGLVAAAFEWLGPPDGTTPVANSSSLTIYANSSTSQLQIQPLQQSHNGSYSCRAQTNEDTLLSQHTEISVKGTLLSIIFPQIIFLFSFSSLNIG